MTTPFDVVEVEWLDSVRASGGWTDLEQIATDAPTEALVHRTAGYLVAEDETSMLIAGSYQAWLAEGNSDKDRSLLGVIRIPDVAIVRTRVLLEADR